MVFGKGISREGDLLDLGVEHGMLEKSGAHYTYRDTRLGMGREKAKEFLRTNADVAGDLEAEVRDLLLTTPPSDEEAKADATENSVTA